METDFKCVRCRQKEGIYSCTTCDPYVYFCALCDHEVHNLTSKKNHHRVLVDPEILLLVKERKNLMNSHSYTSLTTKSKIKEADDILKRTNDYFATKKYKAHEDVKDIKGMDARDVFKGAREIVETFSPPIRTEISINDDEKKEKTKTKEENAREMSPAREKLNIDELDKGLITRKAIERQTSSSARSSLYTSDYVLSIKNFYENERKELVYKINTLKNINKKSKETFAEELNVLQRVLDNTKKSHSEEINILREEHLEVMNKLKEEHKKELDDARKDKENEIKKFLEVVDGFKEKLDKEAERNRKLLYDNGELNLGLKGLKNDMESQRLSNEKAIHNLTNKMETEKRRLTNSFEDRIKEKERELLELKDSFMKSLREKEEDISDMLIKEQNDKNSFNRVIEKLKSKNERYKEYTAKFQEKIRKNEEDIVALKSNIKERKESEEKLQKEIYSLKIEKFGLVDDKNELANEIAKLNKILYGKHTVNGNKK